MSLNVISDIAGNYKTFLALLKKMPDANVVSVGDIIDRGPSSREVIEWFSAFGQVILGNHEHMCVDYHSKLGLYNSGTWFFNGGGVTLDSYGTDRLPDNVIEWMRNLPLTLDYGKFRISHSFAPARENKLDVWSRMSDRELNSTLLWNRGVPIPQDKIQIVGHNSQWGYREFSNENGIFGLSIDTSRNKIMTGVVLPSMEVFSQSYID